MKGLVKRIISIGIAFYITSYAAYLLTPTVYEGYVSLALIASGVMLVWYRGFRTSLYTLAILYIVYLALVYQPLIILLVLGIGILFFREVKLLFR